MTLPKKITPCPILEAVAEVRFNKNIDIESDAVFGKVYDGLKGLCGHDSKIEHMPITQLPKELRDSDPSLSKGAWYRFSGEEFNVMMSPTMFAVVAKKDYFGWKKFKTQIEEVTKIFLDQNIIISYNRVAMRYVDAFDFDIIENADIAFNMLDGELKYKNATINTVVDYEGYTAVLNIMNNAKIRTSEGTQENSKSILDIDMFELYSEDSKINVFSVDQLMNVFNEIHDNQKKLFFDMLKPETLEKKGCKIEYE